ncbi:MAG TPA: ETC complex I subunit [Alphaproteobacteria bacterium]|nr:ETC complex I subunit [Alphaproteobacteria bacterium]
MQARIFRPAKTAMQSARGNTREWILEFEPRAAKRPDPLMGWAGSTDTTAQVTLRFASQAEAIAYARRHGIEYALVASPPPKFRPKSYAENFRYDRVE